MLERWLRTNSRICGLNLVGAALLAVAGTALSLAASGHALCIWLGIALTTFGGLWSGIALGQLVCPRIGYRRGHLFLFVRGILPLPIRIPIEAVECFFLGQEPSREDDGAEVANVVIRLAESTLQWHDIKVRPSLARSRGGYITICGMWCEPLSIERVNHMNKRLAIAKKRLGNHSVGAR